MGKKLIRITTVPMALRYLLPGQPKFMREKGFDVLLISNNGPELEAVKHNEQCRHIIVPLTRKITPFKDLACLFQLVKIFKKEKPDIVHTHTPKAGLIGMLAAKFAGVKVRIHTVAGLPLTASTGVKKKLLIATEKITYAAATHVWPNSKSLLQIIKENKFCKERKLEIIGQGSTNGVSTQRFNKQSINTEAIEKVKRQINYSENNTYLLFIGRLVKDKGLTELVNVFADLLKLNAGLRLILVGKYEPDLDPLSDDIIKTIESCKEITHINWADNVEHFMAVAHFFVFPSHREGFPNVVLQSGAMGLPVICSLIEGNVDIVEHGKTGLLFEKGNEAALKKQLEFALANKNQMQQMANTLNEKVVSNYDTETMWKLILKKYNSLI